MGTILWVLCLISLLILSIGFILMAWLGIGIIVFHFRVERADDIFDDIFQEGDRQIRYRLFLWPWYLITRK